ncbi:MAG: hypothetical protein AAB758_03045 [Patescibacteria group bacterium]
MDNLVMVVGALALMFLIYLVGSFVITPATHFDVVFRLGKFHRIKWAGPGVVWLGFETRERYSIATHHEEIPAEPEKVYRGDPPVPPGMREVIRIPHSGLREAYFWVKKEYKHGEERWETEDPFDNALPRSELTRVRFSELPGHIQEAMEADSIHSPLTAEWAVIFTWSLKSDAGKRITQENIKNFIENVNPQVGRDREQEVRKRGEDVIVGAMGELLAPTTVGHARYMSKLFSDLIKERLEIIVGEKEDPETKSKSESPWGIQIHSVSLKPPNLGETVNKARAEAAAATSKAQDRIRGAEGEAQAVVIEAKGKGDAAVELATRNLQAGKLEFQRERVRVDEVLAVVAKDEALAEVFLRDRRATAYRDNTSITHYAPVVANVSMGRPGNVPKIPGVPPKELDASD